MGWIFLLIASIMEIGWLISLKYTEGFTKLIPMLFYAFFGFTSAYFLSNSLKTIPLSIAYSIWMGIAVIGITAAESIIYEKSFDWSKFFFMILIISGIVGLKFTSEAQQ